MIQEVMKPIELIRFAEQNENEIRSKDDWEQENMMIDMLRCVLRPFSMPENIRNQMTYDEFEEYKEASKNFTELVDIPIAIEWVKNWINT